MSTLREPSAPAARGDEADGFEGGALVEMVERVEDFLAVAGGGGQLDEAGDGDCELFVAGGVA